MYSIVTEVSLTPNSIFVLVNPFIIKKFSGVGAGVEPYCLYACNGLPGPCKTGYCGPRGYCCMPGQVGGTCKKDVNHITHGKHFVCVIKGRKFP